MLKGEGTRESTEWKRGASYTHKRTPAGQHFGHRDRATARGILAFVPMLRPGDRLGGRYELVEPIAVSPVGTLWRARELELGADLGLMLLEDARSDGVLKRFKRTDRVLARLKSPHIAKVRSQGWVDGRAYVALELAAGESLAARLARLGPASPSDCARILDGVAKAVQGAHDAGLLHGGLECASIFLEQRGGVELVKVLHSGLCEAPLGREADLVALARIGLELVTGQDPPQLPPLLDAFFELAFSRAQGQRIVSARELADRYRAALSGLPPPPRQAYDSTPPAARSRSQRTPPHRLARDITIGVVVIVLGVGVALFTSHRNKPASDAARTRPLAPKLGASVGR